MDLARKKFGLLLSTGPERPANLETATGLSEAALARGAQLYLYLIDDGVRALDDPRIGALPDRGARVFVCAYGCQKRGLPLRDADRVTYCGLVVLTDLINGTERFVALNYARVPVPEEQPVLVVIGADPRSSHRAFEAMRIGVGVVAGENEVTFVLRGPAVHLLDADTDDLVDGDDIAKFRDSLKRLGVPFHVETTAIPADPDWNADDHPVVRVSAAEIIALVRQGRRFIIV